MHRSLEPATRSRPAPSVEALLEMAFRPLYVLGSAWALIAIAIWIFAPQLVTGLLPGVVWHAHEMLWGFIATIAVGFLMTAGTNWTGINPMRGAVLAAACLLWIVARLGLLAGTGVVYWIATGAGVAFFVLAAFALMRAVHRSKNSRNYALPWLLLGLGATDGLYLIAAPGGDYTLLMQRFNAGLLCMALIALVVARRVIPFFAMRAVAGLAIPMRTRSGHVQLGACALAIVFLLAGQRLPLALALTLAGAISLWQVLSWKPLAVMHKPLLWILYAGYALLGVGLLTAAGEAAGLAWRPALPVHVIAVGGFSVLIIGMITRTALGHLGRALELDRSMLASYVLVLCAVALRLAALLPSAYSQVALQWSAAAWIAAFALYLWRFVPMMIRPRADSPAGKAAVIQRR
jgi:uncharacterized protein involved in response to NO